MAIETRTINGQAVEFDTDLDGAVVADVMPAVRPQAPEPVETTPELDVIEGVRRQAAERAQQLRRERVERLHAENAEISRAAVPPVEAPAVEAPATPPDHYYGTE